MTSVNIKEKIYFNLVQRGISAGKSEEEAIRDIPNLINEQLRKDIEEKRL